MYDSTLQRNEPPIGSSGSTGGISFSILFISFRISSNEWIRNKQNAFKPNNKKSRT